MLTVGVDSGSLYRQTQSLHRLAWSWVSGRLTPFYTEPGKLSQWLIHDDSTINIVLELLLLSFYQGKPAHSEPVSKPGNKERCSGKGIWHKNTLGCMAGLTLTLVCVTAAGLLLVIK